MATDPDPYRTLGLSRTASTDEIRRAYRRLAKANHPDSAGDAALPRFLAIQAAYETLVGPTADRPGGRPGSGAAREPWRADPDRARAARGGAATGGRTRPRPGTRPGGSEPGGSEPGGPAAAGARPGDEPRRPKRRSRHSNRATPGSTTYDAADDEPFEPEWSGGTWYGASSGTYWTINPKEYADPRKHGPEYQRRARRGAGEAASGADGIDGIDGADGIKGGSAEGRSAASEPPPAFAFEGPGPGPAAASSGPAAAGSVDPTPGPIDEVRRVLFDGRAGFGGRVALALVGWPPLGIALATVVGEVTGCSRFAAGCLDLFGVGTWLAQLAIIAILLALPPVAMLSATGTVAALAAAVPTAVILSATGGSSEPVASAAALASVLAVSYVAGVVFGIARRRGPGRVP
jgi:curved DNA-binding protein CbpA